MTVRSLPEWRSKYFHLAMRRGRKIAKVAMARSLRSAWTGCGARDGIMHGSESSVRTWDSPEIAMV